MSECKFKEGDKIRHKKTGRPTEVTTVDEDGDFWTRDHFSDGTYSTVNYFTKREADLFELVEPAGPLTLGVGTGEISLSAEDLKKHGIYAPVEEAPAPPKYCCIACAKYDDCDGSMSKPSVSGKSVKVICADGSWDNHLEKEQDATLYVPVHRCSQDKECLAAERFKNCWQPKEECKPLTLGEIKAGLDPAFWNPEPKELARRQREHGKRAEKEPVLCVTCGQELGGNEMFQAMTWKDICTDCLSSSKSNLPKEQYPKRQYITRHKDKPRVTAKFTTGMRRDPLCGGPYVEKI